MSEHKDTPARVEALQNLRRSGAAGTHKDKRTKRLRTRAARKEQALKEQKES